MTIEPMKPEEFDAMYDLMEEAFPADERRRRETQRRLLKNPAYRVWVSHAPDGGVQGLLALWEWEDAAYLEHFAVSGACRGQGLGSLMLPALLKRLNKPFFLDVEPPETPLARRRIGFYERLGLHLAPFPFIQPPLDVGQQPVSLLPMTWPEPISEETFRYYQALLHRDVYPAR